MSHMPAAALLLAEKLELRAIDGYPLSAMRYRARGPEKARLLVAGATGVPQGFYRRFAEFAAGQGYTVLTFDYRGVGGSAPKTLRGFEASFLDWARLDRFGLPQLQRVLDAYRETAPLAEGWPERVALHQLFPLLVHAALFGGGYGSRAADSARSLL